jgi:hypothetical protein
MVEFEKRQLAKLCIPHLCFTQIRSVKGHIAEIDLSQICSLQIGRVEHAVSKIRTWNLNALQISVSKLDTSSHQDSDGIGGGCTPFLVDL